MQQFLKCVPPFDKKSHHTFMVCLWICAGSVGIRIVTLFVERGMCHIFTAKGAAILGFRYFTRWHTAARPSKCGAFGGRKAAHMPPCFQLPLQFDFCIIFDAYDIYERTSLQTFWKLSFYPLATFSTYRPAIT